MMSGWLAAAWISSDGWQLGAAHSRTSVVFRPLADPRRPPRAGRHGRAADPPGGTHIAGQLGSSH